MNPQNQAATIAKPNPPPSPSLKIELGSCHNNDTVVVTSQVFPAPYSMAGWFDQSQAAA
jgi:hypothetical protein